MFWDQTLIYSFRAKLHDVVREITINRVLDLLLHEHLQPTHNLLQNGV